ncbi:DUF6366 family protein [Calidifontibacillus oryziterrae]|uniref:DUF6366 family protein n=1 Tax=Calidifontibacillus oryziterrae TaxID=1191699 RepID=UPI001C65696D
MIKKRDDKLLTEEQKSTPTGIAKDAIDRSFSGQPQELLKGNGLTILLTLVVIISLIFGLSQCSI